MKKTWIYLTIAAIALVSILAVGVFAAPSIKGDGFKGGLKARKAERIGRILGITDEQRDEIKGILENYRGEFRPLIEGMTEAQRNLRDAITADSYNEKAIRDASNKVGEYRTNLALLIGKVYQDISKVLTPEQKAFIDDFKRMRQDHVSDLLELLDKMPGR